MSGTSMDGIDAVLCRHSIAGDESLLHIQTKYPANLQRELFARIHHYDEKLHEPLPRLCDLDWRVGESFAAAADKLLRQAISRRLLNKSTNEILIGSHGQTIFHDPSNGRTWQIGEAAPITQTTGLTCVSDFRRADVAAGGQGAPLLPFYHQRLLHSFSKRGAAIHNLGGISNFTYFGQKGGQKILLALDTGPANCLLDTAMALMTGGRKTFDRNGQLARSGIPHAGLLRWLMDLPQVRRYRAAIAPKSTGRELFSNELCVRFLERAERLKIGRADAMSTLTAYSAELAAEAYQRFVFDRHLPLQTIYMAGGGSQNLALVEAICARIPVGIKCESLEKLGIPSQALEAQAFGFFAWCTIAGISITRESTTGLKGQVICGKVSPGQNWRALTLLVARKTQFPAWLSPQLHDLKAKR